MFDDFEKYEVGSFPDENWESWSGGIIGGVWKIVIDGTKVFEHKPGALVGICGTKEKFSREQEFEADVRLVSPIQYNDGKNLWEFYQRGIGFGKGGSYIAFFYHAAKIKKPDQAWSWHSKMFELMFWTPGGVDTIFSPDLPEERVTNTAWHKLKLKITGNRVEAWEDTDKIFDVESNLINYLPSEMPVFLYSYICVNHFDNIRVGEKPGEKPILLPVSSLTVPFLIGAGIYWYGMKFIK
jgi:hypothetical protein